MDNMESQYDLVILGGGISGLAAAVKAAERGLTCLLIEREPETGGIWRSVNHDGFIFDFGVHGLYAANAQNEKIVAHIRALANDEFVETDKKTKILFKGKMLDYPLIAGEFFTAYGMEGFFWAATLLYARAKVSVTGSAWMRSFRDYIVGNFGPLLYRIYFEPYVKKVWGVDPTDLSLDAIARRVRRIRLREFVAQQIKKMLKTGRSVSHEGLQPGHFLYPLAGAGKVVDALRRRAEDAGVRFWMNSSVELLRPAESGYILQIKTPEGKRPLNARHVISSIPLPELLALLYPSPDGEVARLINALRYRGIRMLCLLIDQEKVFDAQWIYFQGRDFAFSRINEFKNLSPLFCPPGKTSLAIEYNCDPGDPLWTLPDEALAANALTELERQRMVGPGLRDRILGAFSVRIEHAYPLMRVGTHALLAEAKRKVGAFPNIHSIGRQGDFDYINGDECVKMAFATVESIRGKGTP